MVKNQLGAAADLPFFLVSDFDAEVLLKIIFWYLMFYKSYSSV